MEEIFESVTSGDDTTLVVMILTYWKSPTRSEAVGYNQQESTCTRFTNQVCLILKRVTKSPWLRVSLVVLVSVKSFPDISIFGFYI